MLTQREFATVLFTNGVHRYVNEAEVNTILNGGTYQGRFGDGRVDVTNSDKAEATSAENIDYRVNFKPEHDFDKTSGRARIKNIEVGEGWLEGGYSLDDVQSIEKRNPDGTHSVIYDADKQQQPTQQAINKSPYNEIDDGKENMMGYDK